MIVLLAYIAIFTSAFFVVRFIVSKFIHKHDDFTSLKTVTFGDESAVKPDRWASIISVITVFLLWGAFTNSKWVPIHVPGPFSGETQFNYVPEAPAGKRDEATVFVNVVPSGEKLNKKEVDPGDGFAKNDSASVAAWRSVLISMDKNDEITRKDGAKVVEINGSPIAPNKSVKVDSGKVVMTGKGTLNYTPAKGMQMEPVLSLIHI